MYFYRSKFASNTVECLESESDDEVESEEIPSTTETKIFELKVSNLSQCVNRGTLLTAFSQYGYQ